MIKGSSGKGLFFLSLIYTTLAADFLYSEPYLKNRFQAAKKCKKKGGVWFNNICLQDNNVSSKSSLKERLKEAKKCREKSGVWLNDRCIQNIVFQPLTNHGAGLGHQLGEFQGITSFYAYNLKKFQLHIQFGESFHGLFTGSRWEASRTQFEVYGRYVFDSGLFVGAGLGYGSSIITYSKWEGPWFLRYRVPQYDFATKVSSFLGDFGWQGKDGYYFQASLRPGFDFGRSTNYNESKINRDQRDCAERMIEASYEMSHLLLAFGWYQGY